MALASVNVFTGAPLFALWVGARIEGGNALTMGVVFAVIATLSVVLILLTLALGRLGQAYDALTGRPTKTRQRRVWLRSMRDEPQAKEHAADLSALEKSLVLTVVLAFVAFEVWFFFFAGSSLPNSS
jgi:hypothetical protein